MSVRPPAALRRAAPNRRTTIVAAAAVIVILAMALSTKVVKIDSAANVQSGAFAADSYGATEFPKVQAAIAKDPAAAAKQYGVPTGAGPEYSVKFTGVVGKGDLGTYAVAVPGVPKSLTIAVQTGPAIIGTDLRDATGAITFGQFTNQIDYQNAGAALNTEMKKDVLAKIDPDKLTGKTISVVGAFTPTDPKTWTITPAKLDVR